MGEKKVVQFSEITPVFLLIQLPSFFPSSPKSTSLSLWELPHLHHRWYWYICQSTVPSSLWSKE